MNCDREVHKKWQAWLKRTIKAYEHGALTDSQQNQLISIAREFNIDLPRRQDSFVEECNNFRRYMQLSKSNR